MSNLWAQRLLNDTQLSDSSQRLVNSILYILNCLRFYIGGIFKIEENN